VVVYVATWDVTDVPYGKATVIVFAGSFTVPATPASEYAVMALAEFRAKVTVTVYVAVEPSADFTVYTTGVVKLFAGAAPLVCVVEPTVTTVPVVVYVATNAVTFVPNGMVTAIVFAGSFIVPETPTSEYAVMTGV
jgi:hypothetical protein